MSAYLLIIGDRRALGWILTTRRMAFSEPLRSEPRRLSSGDTLLLYTTRGCFKNPSRDRGRVIGEATVLSAPERAADPLVIGDRVFPFLCDLRLTKLAALGSGPELAEHVPELHALNASGRGWATRLRRPLVPLDDHDAAHLRSLPDYPNQRPTAALTAPYARWAPRAEADSQQPTGHAAPGPSTVSAHH